MDDKTFKNHIDQFAFNINQGKVGLVHVKLENGATLLSCYENVKNKVSTLGGMSVFGWTFLSKRSDEGDYLIAQHHAIWGKPDRTLYDITPYKEGHYPLMVNDSILFLMDLESKPVIINGTFAPTPSKFYPITESTEIGVYMSELETKEISECNKIYKQLKIT